MGAETPPPLREIVHGDALEWLRANPARPECSLVTSLPDPAELGVEIAVWEPFFVEAARLCLQAVPEDGLCIFFQTDRRQDGRWISKARLVMQAAAALETPLLWHRIVLRAPAGTPRQGRPGYAHLLAFSRRARAEGALPDVLPDLGELPWSHSMGTRAARLALQAIRASSPSTRTILNPFCGIGTVLALANEQGFPAIGVERNRKRGEKARTFSLGGDAGGGR